MDLGVECKKCGMVTLDPGVDFCPHCNAEVNLLVEVYVTECENGLSCSDETHHFGLDKHVLIS